MASTEKSNHRDDMTLDFWNEFYTNNSLPWQEKEVCEGLKQNLDTFTNGKTHITAFFPLCGKSVDMKWIYDLGHTVIGVEYSTKGIEEFYKESNIEYTKEGNKYTSLDKRLIVYAMNIFDFNLEVLGKKVDAIWDRGSFVAINYSDRTKYSELMKTLCSEDCRYLLDVYEYDSNVYGGPPIPTSRADVDQHFGSWGTIEKVHETDEVKETLKARGMKTITRNTYLMKPK